MVLKNQVANLYINKRKIDKNNYFWAWEIEFKILLFEILGILQAKYFILETMIYVFIGDWVK